MPSRSADFVGGHEKLLNGYMNDKRASKHDTGCCSTDECCFLLLALLL
jgi:hypothetical protein